MSERKAPARFLCMAEKDSLSEIGEIPHTKADTLQNLNKTALIILSQDSQRGFVSQVMIVN